MMNSTTPKPSPVRNPSVEGPPRLTMPVEEGVCLGELLYDRGDEPCRADLGVEEGGTKQSLFVNGPEKRVMGTLTIIPETKKNAISVLLDT